MKNLDEVIGALTCLAPELDKMEEDIYAPLLEKFPEEANSFLFARDVAYLKGVTDVITSNLDSIEMNIIAALIRISSNKEN